MAIVRLLCNLLWTVCIFRNLLDSGTVTILVGHSLLQQAELVLWMRQNNASVHYRYASALVYFSYRSLISFDSWRCCGEGIALRYGRRLSSNPTRRRRFERNFLDERGPDIQAWLRRTLLEVKIPIVLPGTVGFSPSRDVIDFVQLWSTSYDIEIQLNLSYLCCRTFGNFMGLSHFKGYLSPTFRLLRPLLGSQYHLILLSLNGNNLALRLYQPIIQDNPIPQDETIAQGELAAPSEPSIQDKLTPPNDLASTRCNSRKGADLGTANPQPNLSRKKRGGFWEHFVPKLKYDLAVTDLKQTVDMQGQILFEVLDSLANQRWQKSLSVWNGHLPLKSKRFPLPTDLYLKTDAEEHLRIKNGLPIPYLNTPHNISPILTNYMGFPIPIPPATRGPSIGCLVGFAKYRFCSSFHHFSRKDSATCLGVGFPRTKRPRRGVEEFNVSRLCFVEQDKNNNFKYPSAIMRTKSHQKLDIIST
ncbi:uncharacterized protein BDR25DRAFT_360468 [Lindgomyces ingoldianus]|uniref:Uncharacterized protein n=1 Tax=Lindgomyces ingoldianus TaxID=673940 RepID=A0ACB6QGM8_9PLEO|nr:uncharacterized protein BDR25DRAFT_360468 [Lindgomyces ingoldianus]KAF2465522.1 hypothetical protein BDR25DRAFT_360468 [Lindgomyces ingoldianus]